MAQFQSSTVIQARERIAACALGEGTALLDLNHSQYFSLNPVAADVWALVRDPTSVGDVVRFVRANYETGDASVESDVARLLADLTRFQLVQVVSA